jgi:hypothetical protein
MGPLGARLRGLGETDAYRDEEEEGSRDAAKNAGAD